MSAALQLAPETEPPTAEIYSVTPAVAKRWLTRNVRNRTSRPSVINAYARDMSAGNWRLTGEAIKFDTNGALADGQHRLRAIIQSGVTVQMLIVRGVEPDAQAVMDSGAKRSASDALTLDGRRYGTILAAIARLALREPSAGFAAERTPNPTNSEIADFIEQFPQVDKAAEMASYYYPAFDCPPSVIGVCWMRFSAIDLEQAAQFFTALAEVKTDGAGDPRAALIRRLQTARRNKERMEQATYLSLVFRTWNAWRGDKRITKLPTAVSGDAIRVPDRLR